MQQQGSNRAATSCVLYATGTQHAGRLRQRQRQLVVGSKADGRLACTSLTPQTAWHAQPSNCPHLGALLGDARQAQGAALRLLPRDDLPHHHSEAA